MRSFSPTSETFIYDYVTGTLQRDFDAKVLAFERVNADLRPFEGFVAASDYAPNALLRTWLDARDRVKPAWHAVGRAQSLALRRALSRQAPSVVHAHFGPNGLAAADGARAAGAPLLVSFHGYDVAEVVRGGRRESYRELFRRAAAITVVSERQKRLLREAGCSADRLEVVRVGKRPSEWSLRAPSRSVRRFVSVGRFVAKKGHLDAIRAFESLARTVPERGLSLEIIGGGPLAAEVAAYVAEHDLSSVVTLAGELPHAEVKRRLELADAFVLASKTDASGDEEGVPTVLMEALALGLPCVSTQHAGIPEVIPEAGQELLAPEGDVAALAERIAALASFDVERLRGLAEAGRAKIERDFNLDTELDKLARLYHRLCSANV